MKRLALRLSITAVFLACGVIAIAQSLKTSDGETPKKTEPTTASAPPSVLPDNTTSLLMPPKIDDQVAQARLDAKTNPEPGGAGYGQSGPENRYSGSPAATPPSQPAYGQSAYGGSPAPSAYGQNETPTGQGAYGQTPTGPSAYGQSGQGYEQGDQGGTTQAGQTAYGRGAQGAGGQGSYGQGAYGQSADDKPASEERVVVTSSTTGIQASVGDTPTTQVALTAEQDDNAKTDGAKADGGPASASLTDSTANVQSGDAEGSPRAQGAAYGVSNVVPSVAPAGQQADPGDYSAPSGNGAVQAAAAPPYSDQVGGGAPVPIAPAGSAATSAAVTAAGTPGNEALEGAQRPSLTIEKYAPREIQVDSPVKFEILVKNEGRADALDVMVVDSIPQGTQLIKTTPTFDQQAEDGSLVWRLGTLKSGDSRTIEIELLPLEESEEVGSVARVLFEAHASVKTRCTKPELVIEGKGPEKVMIGDDAILEYTIVNQGTGDARNVVILEDVPDGFTHAAGKELEYEIGTLRPNERYPVRLKLRADEARLGVVNVLRAKGEGRAVAEKKAVIDIVAPQLAIQLQGPKTRYLNRKGKYQAQLINSGTAPARNVDVVVRLPKGVRFVESTTGEYDDRSHLVYWNVKQLDPQKQESFDLTVTPQEIGSQRFAADAQGNLSSKVSSELETAVDGLSELTFSVIDVADPIELGGETTYEIVIQNIGTKSDSNVNLLVALPQGIQFKSAQGATRNSEPQQAPEGQLIQFAPIAKIGPNQDAKFRITVTGEIAGSHRIGVQVSSDEASNPVTREESTRVLPADG